MAVTVPPKRVASSFSTRLIPQATITIAVVKRPSQNPKSRRPSRQRMRSRLSDEKTKAPRRPKAYMSPNSAIWPRVIRITRIGTEVAMAMATKGVLKIALRSAMIWGRKPRFASARKTW